MGTQYKLNISAENFVGEGEISDDITFTFANPPIIFFYICWNSPSSSTGDNNIGYKIYLNYLLYCSNQIKLL